MQGFLLFNSGDSTHEFASLGEIVNAKFCCSILRHLRENTQQQRSELWSMSTQNTLITSFGHTNTVCSPSGPLTRFASP